MGAREKWTAAAREVTGHEVLDAVPVVRHKPGAALFTGLGVLAFAGFVFPHELGLLPAPSLLAYFAGALAMTLTWQLGKVPVFAVLTPSALVVTSSSRWRLRPVAPVLGPVDPATVTGPTGLLRNTYDIGGTRHQVGWQVKGRFEQALQAARSGHATR